VLVLVAAYGFALSLFGFSLLTHPLMAKLMLALAGMFGVMQLVSTNAALQMAAPDHLRGRVVSLHTWAINAPAPFAALLIGKVAQLVSAPTAVLIGACFCASFALLLTLIKEVRQV
jgi:hypothetical protein